MSTTNKIFDDKRELFILGGEQHRAMVKQQLELIQKDSNAVKERDLIVTVVPKESALWDKYKVPGNAFTVILVGKDGTVKHRTTEVLTAKALFAIIDAMPMRRSEMKAKN
jgi:hypothetical protein